MKKEYLIYFDSEEDYKRAEKYFNLKEIEIKAVLSPYYIKIKKRKAKTKVAFYSLVGGIIGLIFAFLLILWLGTYDYPLNTGGKPTFFLPASLPVIFSVTVLFASLSAFFAFLFNSQLPKWYIPNLLIEKAEADLKNKFNVLIAIDVADFDDLLEKLILYFNLSGCFTTEII